MDALSVRSTAASAAASGLGEGLEGPEELALGVAQEADGDGLADGPEPADGLEPADGPEPDGPALGAGEGVTPVAAARSSIWSDCPAAREAIRVAVGPSTSPSAVRRAATLAERPSTNSRAAVVLSVPLLLGLRLGLGLRLAVVLPVAAPGSTPGAVATTLAWRSSTSAVAGWPAPRARAARCAASSCADRKATTLGLGTAGAGGWIATSVAVPRPTATTPAPRAANGQSRRSQLFDPWVSAGESDWASGCDSGRGASVVELTGSIIP
jgi:hypothetical protein